MRFTKFSLVVVLVCLLSQLALGEKDKKRKLFPATYKTTAKIFLKDEYRMYDSAIAVLEEAVSFYPDDAELHFLLGTAYYHKNRSKEMGEQFVLAESLKIDPKSQEEIQQMKQEKWLQIFNQGATAFNEHKLDSALERFTTCTVIDPSLYRAFMYAGYTYSMKGENDKAISYLKNGLKLAPDSLDILKIYAAVLDNAGKPKEALEAYLKIAEKDPKDVNTLTNIIAIHTLQKDFDKALFFSQKLIEVDSSFKDAYFNLGSICLQQIRETNLSLDSLKDSAGVYRTDEKSKSRKEELEKRKGELFTKAETVLGRAAKLDTLDLEAQLLLAEVYMEQDKLDEAMQPLELLAQRDSTNCEVLRSLWAVYAKQGIAEKANETRKKAEALGCLKKE
jgi:tetratricopeptide (TPR) repeat protein